MVPEHAEHAELSFAIVYANIICHRDRFNIVCVCVCGSRNILHCHDDDDATTTVSMSANDSGICAEFIY